MRRGHADRALAGDPRPCPQRGSFVGVDEQAYPRDFASFGNYQMALEDIPARYPIPGPLRLDQLRRFLDEAPGTYRVEWHGLDDEVVRPGPVNHRWSRRAASVHP